MRPGLPVFLPCDPRVQGPQTYPVLMRCSAVSRRVLMLLVQQQIQAGGLTQRRRQRRSWGHCVLQESGHPVITSPFLPLLNKPSWPPCPAQPGPASQGPGQAAPSSLGGQEEWVGGVGGEEEPLQAVSPILTAGSGMGLIPRKRRLRPREATQRIRGGAGTRTRLGFPFPSISTVTSPRSSLTPNSQGPGAHGR